ncbi:MAG: copper resistance protein CopC [Anaerolineales bacterium]
MLATPLVAALFLLHVIGAEAHAAYIRSDPGQGALIATEPERVDIWFTQDLFRRQGENWIHVVGPNGELVHAGEALIDDDDRRHMWVELRSPLTPGEYRVEWHSLSAEDGDDEQGEFEFTLDPQALVTSTPMQAEAETPAASPTLAAEATIIPSAESANDASPDADEPDSSCALGVAPAFALAAVSLGIARRRQ